MSKGIKSNKTKKCPGKENLERINYLYQATNTVIAENKASHIASVMYSNLLVAISKKAVQRLDIEVKRTICKGCRTLLVSGVTCKVNIKRKQARYTCLKCNTTKIFDLKNKNYEPWTQRDESVVEILEYKPQA